MAIINPEWYSENEQRNYPLADIATAVDDSGLLFPEDLLVDLNIRIPYLKGTVLFLSGMSITSQLVSFTILAAPSLSSSLPDFIPVASLAVRRPVIPHRNYPVVAYDPYVSGWAVFGRGTLQPKIQNYKFSTSAQSAISGGCARAIQPTALMGIGKPDSNNLVQGAVTLNTTGDMQVSLQERSVPDGSGGYVCRQVVLFELSTATNPQAFSAYAGPCAGRPEASTCGRVPIQTINGIRPDCAGNIKLKFNAPIVQTQVDGGFPVIAIENGLLLAADVSASKDMTAGGTILLNSAIGLSDLCPVRDEQTGFSAFNQCQPQVCGDGGSLATTLAMEDLPLRTFEAMDGNFSEDWNTSGSWEVLS
jgi:hypothetical protein